MPASELRGSPLLSAPMQCGVHVPVAADVPARPEKGKDAALQFSISQCLVLWQQICLSAGEEARQATPEGPVAKRRRTVTSARPGRKGTEAAPSRVGCCGHVVCIYGVVTGLLQSTAEAAVQLYDVETGP